MNGQQIGYRRVSSTDQTTARQLDSVELDRAFEDQVSGATTDRPQLRECLAYLREGDTLHVHSIDRLARNLADLQAIVEDLNKRGVSVRFHKESLTFTGKSDPMATLMLQMMGAFAQFERSLIRERQREGIAAAKAAGKALGRKASLSPAKIEDLRARRAAGESPSTLAAEFGISRSSVYNYLGDA